MSMNIPKDPHPIQPPRVSSQPDEPSDSTGLISSSPKDSLTAARRDDPSLRLLPQANAAPQLEAPQVSSSFSNSFRIWTEALRSFRNQLSASEFANLESRTKFSQLAVSQAEEFARLIKDKENAISKIQKEVAGKLEDLQKQLTEMQELQKKQQAEIDQINAGNGLEKEQYEKLQLSYEKYMSQLESIGVKDLGNGHFLIPEDAKDQYNAFTSDYQKAVENFNTYWKGRSEQINKYNTSTAAYNNKVAEYNSALERFIKENHLSDYIQQNGIVIPKLVPASRRDISGYQERIDMPPLISSAPISISIHPLSANVQAIAQAGPSSLPRLPTFQPFDVQKLYHAMYKDAYETHISSIEQSLIQYTSYWSFMIQQNIEGIDQESMLNSKALADRLLFPRVRASASSESLTMQALGTDNPHLQVLIGQALLKEAIANAHIEAVDKLNQEEKEKMIAQLADQILLLSMGLLGNQSVQALFPSLGLISEILNSLPKDSPVIAILFAISLANRIQEDVGQGVNFGALQNYLNTIPELAGLSTEDKAKLGAALNLGQLLVAFKLLEENLGLHGLFELILPAISTDLIPPQLILKARQENQQEILGEQNRVKEHFINEGYSEEQAQFLAQMGVDLTEQGLLTPQMTSNISAKNVQQPLLTNSIKAELVLAHYSLEEASDIAHKVVSQTLSEGPFASAKQFRAALESHLTDLQVKNSPEIAMGAVLIPTGKTLPTPSIPFSPTPPPTSSPLRSTPSTESASVAPASSQSVRPTSTAQMPDQPASESPAVSPAASPSAASSVQPIASSATPISAPPTTAAQSTAPSSPLPQTTAEPSTSPTAEALTPPAPLSPRELMVHVEKQVLQLLVPQLGAPLAKQVSQEIAKTLFGTANPEDLRDRDIPTPSPYALVNAIREQLHPLNIKHNQEWASAVTETFKESIKTMESFYAFSLKIMDPAYLYVFASGIIYGEQGKKKNIDIPI